MKFKFVDKLEKEAATYLPDYNSKGWVWAGTPNQGKFPEGVLTDDQNDAWSWSARYRHLTNLLKRLEDCQADLFRV